MKKFIKRSNNTSSIHLKYEDETYLAKITFSDDCNNIDPLYTLVVEHKYTKNVSTYTIGHYSIARAYNFLDKIKITNTAIYIIPKSIKTRVYNQEEKHLKFNL